MEQMSSSVVVGRFRTPSLEYGMVRDVVRAVSATVLVVASLSACSGPTPAEEASTLTVPATVWSDGAPQGEADTSEWADALRRRSRIENLAFILGDYSSPGVIHELGYDNALYDATIAQESRFEDPGVWGDRKALTMARSTASLLEVLAVTPSPDGKSAQVEVCWGFPGAAADKFDAGLRTYEITRLEGDRYEITHGSVTFDPTCSPAQIPHEIWAVPFDPDHVGRDEVKMPLPRDYYVDLGVISE